MKEIILKGPEDKIEKLLFMEKIYMKRHGITVVRRKTDKGPVKKAPAKKPVAKKTTTKKK